jgi:hypothetical protein
MLEVKLVEVGLDLGELLSADCAAHRMAKQVEQRERAHHLVETCVLFDLGRRSVERGLLP